MKKILKAPNDAPIIKEITQENREEVKERIKGLLPKNTYKKITDEVADLVLTLEKSTGLPQEAMEEQVMSNVYLLSEIKHVTVKDLINAVKFCTLKRHYTDVQAFSIVFPDKYKRVMAMDKESNHIHAHVHAFNRTKVVIAIEKAMLIPVYLQYRQHFDAAINKQYSLMMGKAADSNGQRMTVTPMVQHLAAKELAMLTKPPEETQINLTLTPSDKAIAAQKEMNTQLEKLVQLQAARLQAGEEIETVQAIDIDFDGITQKIAND
jgi:hypothetical protein